MTEIVAEISGNHGGSLEKAKELIFWASWAGCDYAKFQYYRPEDMSDRRVGDNDAMYHRLMVPDEWLPELFDHAHRCNIGLFASVFSARAIRELAKYDISYVKLASPSSTWLPTKVYQEIREAVPAHVDIIGSAAGPQDLETMRRVTPNILYCPIGYPPTFTIESMNEYAIGTYRGLSDHTSGIGVPASFARIAKTMMIEKHLKLEGDKDCEDAHFSAEPLTMKLLCKLAHK